MPIEPTTRNVSEVLTAVKRQFGDESGVQVTDSDIFRWVDDAQREIVIKNPSVLAVFLQLNVESDKESYPLLSEIPDILRIHSIHYKGQILPHMTFLEAQEFIIREGEQNSGVPRVWYEYGGVLHLWPVPQETLEAGLSIYYNKAPARVQTSGDLLSVPDNYFKVVVDYCLAQAYEMDENMQMAQMKEDQYGRSIAEQSADGATQQRHYPTIQILPEDWS